MQSCKRTVGYGVLLWLIPFLVSFLFFDASTGTLRITETFFKTIMVVTSSLVGVYLAVRYFRNVRADHVREGVRLGLAWLAISWALDLAMVGTGFFDLSVVQYFTDIGLRYLAAPIYTTGLGYALVRR